MSLLMRYLPDDGGTWDVLSTRPKGDAVGLIVTDQTHGSDPRTGITMYLALRDEGVFRSTDGGTRWDALKGELRGERISAMAAVEGTVFTGTNRGLYRLDSDVWKRLPVALSEAVYSLTVFEKRLYVGTGPDLFGLESSEGRKMMRSEKKTILGRIFRSSDLGESWTEITPSDIYHSIGLLPSGIKVLAAGETLLALSATGFRSTNGGETWTNLGMDPKLYMLSNYPSVSVNENTFYKTGVFGVHRTTDGGDTWHLFMDGMIGTRIEDLVVFKDVLNVYTGNEVYQSTNGGMSWNRVRIDAKIGETEVNLESVKDDPSGPNFSPHSKWVVDGGNLYFLSPTDSGLQIYRLSTNDNVLIPVRDVPGFDFESVSSKLTESARLSEVMSPFFDKYVKAGTAVVSNGVLYVEYKRRLFRWKLGAPTWKNTGLVDTVPHFDKVVKNGFKFVVSGDTIYVGKRDGRLFHSLNGGDSWRDVTPNLPLRFTAFKDIVFLGSTVYVSTDAGILASETGEYWNVITDGLDTGILIDRFAVAGSKIYGIDAVGTGYRLDTEGQWEKVSEAAIDDVVSFAVTDNKLYSVVKNRGVFQISLAEEW